MNKISDEIFHDKTIYSLYIEARKYVVSKNSIIFSKICSIFLFVFSVLGVFLFHEIADFSKITAAIRSEMSLGISYTSSILGFLVSGFALFFALINKDEAKKLLNTPYPKTEDKLAPISCLRMTLYSFMYVFIHYISFLLCCLIFDLLFPDGGPLQYITSCIYRTNSIIMKSLCLAFLSCLSGWFIYLVCLLKSFVWNLYQAILLSIALNCIEDDPTD